MRVYLCEKPSQGKDLAAALGFNGRQKTHYEIDGGIITWGFGHIVQLCEPESYGEQYKKWRLDTLPIIPKPWKQEVSPDKKAQFNFIKQKLKSATEVVIATDADREGELIGREILDLCGYNGKITRLWCSDNNPDAIRKAHNDMKPGKSTEDLYHAALSRSKADWLVGMNLTRAFTKYARKFHGIETTCSIGRVQTPVLNLIVQRDLEIENFVPKDFYDVVADVTVKNGSFKAKWMVPDDIKDEEGRCLTKSLAEAVVSDVKGTTGVIAHAKTERKKTAPPLPYSLSTLQTECSDKYSLTAQDVLDICQKLYETYKLTSYPRSDCNHLPTEQLNDVDGVLASMVATDGSIQGIVAKADKSLRTKAWNDKKVGESAHYAIIPTQTKGDISSLSANERKVYDLIRRRYLAQFFPDYEYDRSVILVRYNQHGFVAQGNVPAMAGWKEVYGMSGNESDSEDNDSKDDDSQSLPVVSVGEDAKADDAKVIAKKTTPPKPYTDGTLLNAMKFVHKHVDKKYESILKGAEGIGTEATRANIIEVLLKRTLSKREKKKFIRSTPAGRQLIEIVPESVKSPVTTAIWEMGLEQIAKGLLNPVQFESDVETLIKTLIDEVKTLYGEEGEDSFDNPLADCPCCGAENAAKRIYSAKRKMHSWVCGSCDVWMDDVNEKPVRRAEKLIADCPCCDGKDTVEQVVKKDKTLVWKCKSCNTWMDDDNGGPIKPPEKLHADCPACGKENGAVQGISRGGNPYWKCASCNEFFYDEGNAPVPKT